MTAVYNGDVSGEENGAGGRVSFEAQRKHGHSLDGQERELRIQIGLGDRARKAPRYYRVRRPSNKGACGNVGYHRTGETGTRVRALEPGLLGRVG